jgi:hypothetical protein
MYYYVSSFIPDTANANIVSTDVYLKITRRKLSLLFEMLPGFKANKFIDELMKASEGEYSFFCFFIHCFSFILWCSSTSC